MQGEEVPDLTDASDAATITTFAWLQGTDDAGAPNPAFVRRLEGALAARAGQTRAVRAATGAAPAHRPSAPASAGWVGSSSARFDRSPLGAFATAALVLVVVLGGVAGLAISRHGSAPGDRDRPLAAVALDATPAPSPWAKPGPDACRAAPMSESKLAALIAMPLGTPAPAPVVNPRTQAAVPTATRNGIVATWQGFWACVYADEPLRAAAYLSDGALVNGRRFGFPPPGDLAVPDAGALSHLQLRVYYGDLSAAALVPDGRVVATFTSEYGEEQDVVFVAGDQRWLIEDVDDVKG